MIAIIVKALYGLTTSAERFHTLFSDFFELWASNQHVLIVMFGCALETMNPDMITFALT